MLLGVFQVSIPHNIVHLLFGVAGTTLLVGFIVALVTTLLALLGAMAVRRSRSKRLLLMMLLLPLFIPGVSLALAIVTASSPAPSSSGSWDCRLRSGPSRWSRCFGPCPSRPSSF